MIPEYWFCPTEAANTLWADQRLAFRFKEISCSYDPYPLFVDWV